MTEQELNVFLDLEWNCAAFTPEEPSVSAPLSPKQWARIISRHPELQEFCPFSEFTPDEWIIVLEKQPSLAWRCTCWKDFTPAKWQRLLRHQPTLLHYCEIPDHPAVRSGLLASDSYFSTDIDTHDFTLCDWFWPTALESLSMPRPVHKTNVVEHSFQFRRAADGLSMP